MDEEILMADVSAKLDELGLLADNDLPKYVVKLLLNQQYTIERIKQDLSLFCDNDFLDWIDIYAKDKRPELNTSKDSKKNIEIISASEIEDDVLDFEEGNLNEEMLTEDIKEENDLDLNNSPTNKRKFKEELDDQTEQCNKKLLNNDKEIINLNNIKKEKDSTQNVINLKNNQHLNDIGLMRRKAMEEKNKLNQQQQQSSNNHQKYQEQKTEFNDLREKLNRNKAEHLKDEHDVHMNSDDDNKITVGENDDKKTRCKFWPLCKKENECIYHHPTEQCKKFPNCTQNDKCLFIHPLCKFDAKCAFPDCQFLHITKKQQLIPISIPIPQPTINVECKFFPNCLNPNCPFVHRKLCMFGAACKNLPQCKFRHPELQQQNIAKPHQLKYVAKNLTNSESTTTNITIKNENDVENEENLDDSGTDDQNIEIKLGLEDADTKVKSEIKLENTAEIM